LLLRGATDIEKLIQEVMTESVPYDSRIQEYFIKAIQEPLDALDLDEGLKRGEVSQIGYTLKALAAGFWALKNAESFSDGVHKIIHEGGDADTNAAVAGALLGAKFGFSDIPHVLVEDLACENELRSRVAKFIELLEISSSRKTSQSVSGVSGVFIYAKDPKQLAEWYYRILGIGYEYKDGCCYHEFYQRDYGHSGRVSKTRWTILSSGIEAATPTEKPTISYRMQDLNKFIEHLKAAEVKIEKTEETAHGLFAYIQDPEGNRIELFQDKNL
jgi:predicted enzyme related to lactoylglutathione lyase